MTCNFEYSGLHRVSRAGGRSAQSSRRRDTRPGSGAVAKAATTYSIDFLSNEF